MTEPYAALLAARRFLEWSSSERVAQIMRAIVPLDRIIPFVSLKGSQLTRATNYFNDQPYGMYRRNNTSMIWNGRRADKWQSIDPDTSRCFSMTEAEERRQEIFPADLLTRTDYLRYQNRKWIHWNYRACCFEMLHICGGLDLSGKDGFKPSIELRPGTFKYVMQ